MTTAIKISPVDMAARKALALRAGDTVKVWSRIKEGEKSRLQAFEGLVIARKHGAETGATFTVRRVTGGIGVERVFPLYSPNVDKIEVLRSSKVRRSKIYYVREKAAKEIRRKMKQLASKIGRHVVEEAVPESAEVAGETPEGEVKE
ncbi:MAG: 50S ribosomal protein L19 [Candidatus Niyogibacteria bacterium]|nr:50S ribosomal protein L19 [Candidatus Niyogibacteria bacterium]